MEESAEMAWRLEDLENLLHEMPLPVRDLFVLVVAFGTGCLLSKAVADVLKTHGFNEIWTVPWAKDEKGSWGGDEDGANRAALVGLLVKLTGLGVGCWYVATLHEWEGVEDWILSVMRYTWILVVMASVAAYLSRLLAKAGVEILGNAQVRKVLDARHPPVGRETDRLSDAVIQAAGTAIYVVVFVLVFMTAAELLDWDALGTSLSAVWSLFLRVIAAALALLVGWCGLKWFSACREEDALKAESSADGSVEAKEPERTSLRTFLVVAVTLLTIAILSGKLAGIFATLTLLILVVIPLLAFQNYLPDIGAGLYLRFKQVKEIEIDGKPAEIVERGLLFSNWDLEGETVRVSNREALDAALEQEG